MNSLLRKFKTASQLMMECIKRGFRCVPNIESTADSLAALLDTNGSISRFGDGELGTLFGMGQAFQQYDEGLVSRLTEVLESAGKNEPRHYVAVPYAMKSVVGLTPSSKRFWLIWTAQNRRKLSVLYNGSAHYLDSQISRFYINRANREDSLRYLDAWRSLWSGKRILVVEGSLTRFGVNNGLFDNCSAIFRVLCPAKNAWSSYELIIDTVLQHARSLNIDLVLAALGPAATVLSFDLSKHGIRALDVGNLDMEYEWLMSGSHKKVPVDGKYTHEAAGGSSVGDINDEQYLQQIIAKID